VLRRNVIADHLCDILATSVEFGPAQSLSALTVQPPIHMCTATRYCTAPKRLLMSKFISESIARFFAPAFELIGNLPPQALSRIVAPF
jgi:hypothetical protein